MANLLWYLQRLDWIDALDIFLVALIFFGVLYLVRGTRVVPLLRGAIFLIIAVVLLRGIVRLRAFGWLASQITPALLLAIPVLFQQELRRALERLGRPGNLLARSKNDHGTIEQNIASIVEACRTLTKRRYGALIVLEREIGLQELADSGVRLDSVVTPELLNTIFDPHTVLHDGGVVIREGHILAAACVLPLSTAFLADRQLGLRHRAAIGVTEESDAIVVVVSEERGSISIAHEGRIIRNLDATRLETVLQAMFQPSMERAWPRWTARLQQLLRGEDN